MEQDKTALQNLKKLLISKYPRFGAQIASAKLEYNSNLQYHTAATDGKNIYFDPNYLASLNDDDKLFLVAHELMHVKFEHMYRMVDNNGQMRDSVLWNIATDAIINANLQRDGFKIKEGYVNMPEALNFTAEEFYEKLLKEKQSQQQKDGNKNKDGSGIDSQEQKQMFGDKKQFVDDHTLWDEAFKKVQQGSNNQDSKNNSEKIEPQNSQTRDSKREVDDSKFNEKDEFERNRIERKQRTIEKFNKYYSDAIDKITNSSTTYSNIGKSKPVVDWRLILRHELEKDEIIWSQRRSIAENNYAYRLEDNELDEKAEVEVLIDTSGSISENLVKEFLRQLKPILKDAKLKVGQFDTNFYGFTEIKNERDIDNLEIYGGGGTDFDVAVNSFQSKTSNKIIFTDGEADMPEKKINAIWVVYGIYQIDPPGGKVIMVDRNKIGHLNNLSNYNHNDNSFEL